MRTIRRLQDVVDWRLCLGCGACAAMCPERRIRLVDIVDEGIRPVLGPGDCGDCASCLQVCPAFECDRSDHGRRAGVMQELLPVFGPVLEIWEGHATDNIIRYRAASGGLLTALGLFCVEQRGMHGVMHVAADLESPLRNVTRISRTREELIERCGSRYAPASACDSLEALEQAPAPCAFIGQPSEITALSKACRLRPGLKEKVGLTMSFFCAGSPSSRGTLELLSRLGVNPREVGALRYRGHGWPGHFAVTLKGQSEPVAQMTYTDSWGFVQAYRPYSTHVSPDSSGEDADLSCGDPWYQKVTDGEAGLSLVVVRTERGRSMVRDAMTRGYAKLRPLPVAQLLDSQRELIRKRGAIWGRRLALRAFGIPVTRLKAVPLFRHWLRLSLEDKLRSTIGTARRILARGYYRRRPQDAVPR